MRNIFLWITLVAGLFLTACTDTRPSPIVDLIEATRTTPESSATQTQVPTSTSTSTAEPVVSETSRILWSSSSTDLFNRVLTVDPQNSDRLAYCAADEIPD